MLVERDDRNIDVRGAGGDLGYKDKRVLEVVRQRRNDEAGAADAAAADSEADVHVLVQVHVEGGGDDTAAVDEWDNAAAEDNAAAVAEEGSPCYYSRTPQSVCMIGGQTRL